MKSKLLLYLSICCLLTFVFSCKKNQQQPAKQVAPPSAIYITGQVGNNAVYWKNGTLVNLADTNLSVNLHGTDADCVFISGNDVYISGNGIGQQNQITPVYWKNDVLNILPGTGEGTAYNYAIGAIGSDIYCAGGRFTANQAGILWKNGVTSTFGGRLTVVNAITVNNGDLYTSGSDQEGPSGSLIATYYKNQQKVLLNSNGMPAAGDEVAISGSDIYVGGLVFDSQDSTHAAYWKNGVMHIVGKAGSGAVSICVSGNDVYMCGADMLNGQLVATYWKNYTPVHLVTTAGAESQCGQIRVWGDDVYVVGNAFYTNHGEQATVWKNGVGTIIGPYISFASTIAFKP